MYYINLDLDSDARYDMAKFMEYNGCFDILNSYFIKEVRKLPLFGEYVIQNEEMRPDLISYRIYGNTQYWWILLIYNKLTNHEELVNGVVLKYPSLEDLEDLYFKLKTLENS